MKITISKDHRFFFQKQGWIEFEAFFSPDQLLKLNQALDETLAERLHIPVERLRQTISENAFLQGRDLWRSHSFLKTFVTQPRIGQIATELLEEQILRLGYDQLLPARLEASNPLSSSQVYSHFLSEVTSLESVSCVKGIKCGVIIALNEKSSSEKTEASGPQGIDIFPNQPGNAIFFQSQLPIQWENLYAHPGQRYYLIVYAEKHAYYQLQPQDPHTHALKRTGYIFNDKLTDRLNPIVYR